MCVIFWSTDHPDHDLIVASNRDEFLARPTLSASWHCFSSSDTDASSPSPNSVFPVLSARDSTGGGTWLGITRNGSFATLTNFTENPPKLPDGLDAFKSRGELVRDWLLESGRHESSSESPEDRVEHFLRGISPQLDHYPGFNLLIGCRGQSGMVMGYTTNRNASGELALGREPDILRPKKPKSIGGSGCMTRQVPDDSDVKDQTPVSITGLSNSVLQEPWKKVVTGKSAFTQALNRLQSAQSSSNPEEAEGRLIEDLFDVLWTSSTPPPAARLELRNSVLISPLYVPNVKSPDWYATRTSTIILVQQAKEGQRPKATFIERDIFKLDDTGTPIRVSGEGGLAGRSASERRFEWGLEE